MNYTPLNEKTSWSCTGCGICCKAPLIVDLTIEEFERLNKLNHQGRGLPRLLHKLAEDTYVPCMANHLYVGKMQPGCAFYDFDNQCCSIYEDRPGVCRNFPFVFLKKPKINGESEELRLLEREGEEYLGVLDSRTQGIGKGQEYGEEGLKEVQDKYLSLQIKRSEEFRETIEHYQNLLEDIEEDYVPLAGVEGVLVHKHDSYIRTGYEET